MPSRCLFRNTFQGELVLYKIQSLITTRDKLTGFSVVVFTEMYLWTDCVCSKIVFGRDLRLTETGQLICNVNKFTGSYIGRAFIERYFQKDMVVCLWIPFSKTGSYNKETSQLICNTNRVGFYWKTLLHRLWLASPSRMGFFSVMMYYTVIR